MGRRRRGGGAPGGQEVNPGCRGSGVGDRAVSSGTNNTSGLAWLSAGHACVMTCSVRRAGWVAARASDSGHNAPTAASRSSWQRAGRRRSRTAGRPYPPFFTALTTPHTTRGRSPGAAGGAGVWGEGASASHAPHHALALSAPLGACRLATRRHFTMQGGHTGGPRRPGRRTLRGGGERGRARGSVAQDGVLAVGGPRR